MLYRKKQEIVNAKQFWPIPNRPLDPGFIGLDANGLIVAEGETPVAYAMITREGTFPIEKGDVVVTNAAGLTYIEKKDVFYPAHEELDLAQVDTNKLFRMLEKSAFWVAFNMNDTFGWACAESEEIYIEDLPKLMEVYDKFGRSGIDAFAAHQRGYDVMDHKAVRTPLYYAAKDYLKDYEPHGDEFRHRKWVAEHPEEWAKKQADQAAHDEKVKKERGTKWARIKAILFEK